LTHTFALRAVDRDFEVVLFVYASKYEPELKCVRVREREREKKTSSV